MSSKKLASLLELASEELAAARVLTATNPRQAIYQLGQAAEKAARAVCEHEDVQVGPTHNFGQISSYLPTDHPLRAEIAKLNDLSSSSTKYRYPSASGVLPKAPSADQLRTRLADIDAFIERVRAFVAAPDDPPVASPPRYRP